MKLLLCSAIALTLQSQAIAQTTYKYDALGRLIEVREASDPTEIVVYTYDAADNRTKVKNGRAAPVANNDSYFLMITGSTYTGVLLVLNNDTDADLPDDTLSMVSVSGSSYASVVTNGIALTAAPPGWYSLSYTMQDALGTTANASVSAQVVYCNPTCELDP